MKKCPPGVICVENITLFLLFIIIFILGLFIYSNTKQNITINDHDTVKINDKRENNSNGWFNKFLQYRDHL